MSINSIHGEAYDDLPDFFNLGFMNVNKTQDEVIEEFPGLTVIEHPEAVGTSVLD